MINKVLGFAAIASHEYNANFAYRLVGSALRSRIRCDAHRHQRRGMQAERQQPGESPDALEHYPLITGFWCTRQFKSP